MKLFGVQQCIQPFPLQLVIFTVWLALILPDTSQSFSSLLVNLVLHTNGV